MSAEDARSGGISGGTAAIAGILTAIGTIIYALSQFGGGGKAAETTPQNPPAPIVVMPPAPAPAETVSIILSPAEASEVSQETDVVDDTIEACAYGDEDACLTIVESLIGECEGQSWVSCNVLYEVAPVGSELEAWAGECGGRLETMEWAGDCVTVAES
jgi:hypothetical protein